MVQGKKYNYPEGPTQVIPILLSLLPGIDPNDIRKCFVTLNLMIHIINVVPIVDSSLASKYYDDLTEEEHLICEASASFEDFVLQLFDKLCVWVESNSLEFVRMEQSDNDRTNKFESLGENMIYSIIYALLSQCSDEIFMVPDIITMTSLNYMFFFFFIFRLPSRKCIISFKVEFLNLKFPAN